MKIYEFLNTINDFFATGFILLLVLATVTTIIFRLLDKWPKIVDEYEKDKNWFKGRIKKTK